METDNPSFSSPEDVQLTKLTKLTDDDPPTSHLSHDHKNNPPQEIPQRAQPYQTASGSDVFGLCCSSSGHVPARNYDAGGDVNDYDAGGEVTIDDVDDEDVEGRKKGHTALERKLEIEYSVTDVPPVHLCFFFGLQQVLLSISSTISIPMVTSAAICAGDLPLARSEILSTFIFMCGVCTIMQVLVGVRLPIIQGGCGKFIPAVTALMALEKWTCPTDMGSLAEAYHNGTSDNATEIWQSRMREIQGGIMLASLAQILVGGTGFLGVLLEFVGPITIVPAISLVGLSLVNVALRFCGKHWGITVLTVGLMFLFSLYLRNIRVPFPSCTRKKGCRTERYPIFKLLPTEALDLAKWFFFPYPGQWGMPTVSVASFMAMLAATIMSIIESVGDYYACARISGVPPPPAHAMNRGIAIEGLGSLISGAVGSGGATTSYSQNVGSIGFTKVASRWAYLAGGLIFLVCGLCGKLGAFLTTMPDPVLGGIILVSFGMVTAVGLSALSFVDLSSGRNLSIIGSSLMVGLMMPKYFEDHTHAIDTGHSEGDQVLQVLLSTGMFVGGVLAFFLDNTVPGVYN
ncbi:hypothetical protein ACOMHN_059862 [Nucella lapillus]